MNSELKQQWMQSLNAAMASEEAEACLRTYMSWLRDRNVEAEQTEIQRVINRLLLQEPIQYILGEAWFYGRAFQVNRHTLIPRPETEELCELIIKNTMRQNLKLLDVGTGSGCIAVTLLSHNSSWKATALDIDPEALNTAHINAQHADVADRMSFEICNFLQAYESDTHWDLIISNPPYIDRSEQDGLSPNVLDWEPHAALFPDGNDPLIFYKKLADLLHHQNKGCELWAEINNAYAGETHSLFHAFAKNELIKDMSGNERFLHVVK